MDIPKIESRSIINIRMEIFITNKSGKHGIDGNNNLVEFDPLK